MPKTTVIGACRLCKEEYPFIVNKKDVQSYVAGAHVQDAFPYLAPADRELFVSGTCGQCWDKMFAGYDDEEE